MRRHTRQRRLDHGASSSAEGEAAGEVVQLAAGHAEGASRGGPGVAVDGGCCRATGAKLAGADVNSAGLNRMW